MKPIKINNLEDLALAIKLSNAQAVRERNNEPPEYRHFTNAEGDVISKLPEDQQTELKRIKTLPNRKGYIVEDRRPIMSASSNNGKDWTGARCDTPAPLTGCPPLDIARQAVGCAIDALKTAQGAKAKR